MPASEIIINPDHSIYHLKLPNGALAEKVILVGDPERVPLVARYFDAKEGEWGAREFRTVTGRMGNQRISVVSTGIGTDNIDVVVNELALVWQYDLRHRRPLRAPISGRLLRLGTSGALQSDLAVDSFLLSCGALSLDGLLPFYAHDFEVIPIPGLAIPCSYIPAEEGMRRHFGAYFDQEGVTTTAAGFYGPQGRHVSLQPSIPDLLQRLAEVHTPGGRVTNLEMETAGIYGLGHLLGLETLSISALLANRANGDFSKNPERTIQRLIEKGLEAFIALR